MKDDLKQSDASKVGGTNGSMGDAKASDLDRGYTTDAEDGMAEDPSEMKEMKEEMRDGFVGRPCGWER